MIPTGRWGIPVFTDARVPPNRVEFRTPAAPPATHSVRQRVGVDPAGGPRNVVRVAELVHDGDGDPVVIAQAYAFNGQRPTLPHSTTCTVCGELVSAAGMTLRTLGGSELGSAAPRAWWRDPPDPARFAIQRATLDGLMGADAAAAYRRVRDYGPPNTVAASAGRVCRSRFDALGPPAGSAAAFIAERLGRRFAAEVGHRIAAQAPRDIVPVHNVT